ncbi:MAG: peptidylprolyl isomerase [Bacteroidia bacterium]
MQNLNMKTFYALLILLFTVVSPVYAQQKPVQKAKPKKEASPKVTHTIGTTKKTTTRTVPVVKDTFVDIITEYGTMRFRLYKETPMHRTNFIQLAASGFYDSLLFHRVIKDFMIQGGDPTSKNAPVEANLGGGDIGYRIPAEFNKKLFHRKGALAAARDNNPEKASSGCQFYIVQGRKFTGPELSNVINGMNYNNKMQMLQAYTGRDSVKAKMEDYNIRGDQAGLELYMKMLKDQIDQEFSPLMYTPSQEQIVDYMRYGGTPHLDGTYTVFGEILSGLEVIDKIAANPVNGASRPNQDIRMKMKIVIE